MYFKPRAVKQYGSNVKSSVKFTIKQKVCSRKKQKDKQQKYTKSSKSTQQTPLFSKLGTYALQETSLRERFAIKPSQAY